MKTLLMMVGPSGSGKSTLAKKIADSHRGTRTQVKVFSTDDLFYDGADYKFDADKLGKNHRRNRDLVEAAMIEHNANAQSLVDIWGPEHQYTELSSIIIVDNTNIRHRERKPYEILAQKYGYEIKYEIFPTTKADLVKYAARNVHGLSLGQVQKQAARMDLQAEQQTEK